MKEEEEIQEVGYFKAYGLHTLNSHENRAIET